jgi:hypothetical protein
MTDDRQTKNAASGGTSESPCSVQCTCDGDYPWHDVDCPMYGTGDALTEVERLRALIGMMKQEWVQYHNWGQNPLDTLRNIEHLTACGLAPAPNYATRKD